ncbi:MAG: hypothetical protein ACTSUE_13885 [Promethearchaeota archaeon]
MKRKKKTILLDSSLTGLSEKEVRGHSRKRNNKKRFKHSLHHLLKMREEGIDEFKPIFSLAVTRNYPFSNKVKKLYNIMRTCEFMLSYPYFSNKAYSHNVMHDCSSQQMYNDTLFMNLEELYSLEHSRPGHDSMFSTVGIFQKFCMEREFSNDVSICKEHKDHVHICEYPHCSAFLQINTGRMECFISNKKSIDSKNQSQFQIPRAQITQHQHDHKDIVPFYDDKIYRFNGHVLPINNKIPTLITKLGNLCKNWFLLKSLQTLVWNQYEQYNKMIKDQICVCEVITKKKKRKKREKKPKVQKLRVTRRVINRKKRKIVQGLLSQSTSEKLRWISSTKDKKFETKRKLFYSILAKVEQYSKVTIITHTHFKKASEVKKSSSSPPRPPSSSLPESSLHDYQKPMSLEAHYVDTTKPTWTLSSNSTLQVDEPYIFYFNFLLTREVQNVLSLDQDRIFRLKRDDHPLLRGTSKKFKDGLARKIHFIRRLCPGLFRIIMMTPEIKKNCIEKYSIVKSNLRTLHTEKKIPSLSDERSLLEYNYREHYLHKTISDEIVLEIAEHMFWCEEMCMSHPSFQKHGSELSAEYIMIGILYFMQKGLRYKGYHIIIPIHPILSKRGYIPSQNRLTTFYTNRSDVGTGIELLKDVLFGLCAIRPLSEVAFLEWKSQHSQIRYSPPDTTS